jgi:hypothetical protein
MNENVDQFWPRVLHGVAPQKNGEESPYGYACRVAEANGYSGTQIMRLLGRGLVSISIATNFKRISFTLRITERAWGSLAYEYESWGNECLFLKQKLGLEQMCIQTPRVCSACLRSRSIWWAVWDLRFVVACPLHRCILLDKCPNCRGPLRLNRRRTVCLCKCGYDLRCNVALEAPGELIAVAEAIYKAAGFYFKTDLENYCPISSSGEALPTKLSELLPLLLFVGRRGEFGRPPMTISGVSPLLIEAVRTGSIFSIPVYKQDLWFRTFEQNKCKSVQERPF